MTDGPALAAHSMVYMEHHTNLQLAAENVAADVEELVHDLHGGAEGVQGPRLLREHLQRFPVMVTVVAVTICIVVLIIMYY